eukprot:g33425.t1
MDNTTMYEDDFPGMSKKELLGARQPNRKPAQTLTQTVAPPGELLDAREGTGFDGGRGELKELQSHEHRHFKSPGPSKLEVESFLVGKPRAELAKNPRVPPPRQALEMGGAPVDPPKLTTYVREHIWLTASEPELRPTKAEKRKVQETWLERARELEPFEGSLELHHVVLHVPNAEGRVMTALGWGTTLLRDPLEAEEVSSPAVSGSTNSPAGARASSKTSASSLTRAATWIEAGRRMVREFPPPSHDVLGISGAAWWWRGDVETWMELGE